MQPRLEFIAWIDVETTGLQIEHDRLLEISCLVTDMKGISHSEIFNRLITHSDLGRAISETEPSVRDMHEKSGLWEDLWRLESRPLETVSKDFADFLRPYSTGVIYFGGNSITLDRAFVRMNLPEGYQMISHRSVDVTSLSLALVRNHLVEDVQQRSTSKHRATSDILNSVEEYRYYLRQLAETTERNRRDNG